MGIPNRARMPAPKLTSPFGPGLSQPALRALAAAGYKTHTQLARATEADLLALHGLGPSALPKLRAALAEHGLSFAKSK